MLVMPTLRKPVLYNETIAGMSNKTRGNFLRYNAQERDKLQWYKNNSKSC